MEIIRKKKKAAVALTALAVFASALAFVCAGGSRKAEAASGKNSIVDYAIRYEEGLAYGLVVETDADYLGEPGTGLDNDDKASAYLNFKEYLWVNGRSVVPAGAGGFYVSAQREFNSTFRKGEGDTRTAHTVNGDGEHFTLNFWWLQSAAGDLVKYDGTDVFVLKAGMPVNTYEKYEEITDVLDRDYYFRLVWGESADRRYFTELSPEEAKEFVRPAKIVGAGLRDADNGTHYGLTFETDAAKFQTPSTGLDNPDSDLYYDFRRYVFINGVRQSALPPTVTFISAGSVYNCVYGKGGTDGTRAEVAIDYVGHSSFNVNWPTGNLSAAGFRLDGTDLVTIKKELPSGSFDGKGGPYVFRTLDRDYYFRLNWDEKDSSKRFFYEVSPEEIVEKGYDKAVLSIDRTTLPPTGAANRKVIGLGQEHGLPSCFYGFTFAGGQVEIPVSYDKTAVRTTEGNDEVTGTLDFSGLNVPGTEARTFTVYYSVADYPVSLDLGPIGVEAEKEVALGSAHTLPSFVTATLYTGRTEDFPVRWNWTRATRNGKVPVVGTVDFGGRPTAEGLSDRIEIILSVTGEPIVEKLGKLPGTEQVALFGREISLPDEINAMLITGERITVEASYEWRVANETGRKENVMTLRSEYAFAEGLATEYVLVFDVRDYIVSIGEIADPGDLLLGERHNLPTSVSAVLASGKTVSLDVSWKWTTATQIGLVPVTGTIFADGYEIGEGVSLKTVKKVNVSAPSREEETKSGCKSRAETPLVFCIAAFAAFAAVNGKKRRKKG